MSLQNQYNYGVINQSFMSTIQVRIDDKTKKAAQKVLSNLGLDLSGAIKIYLKQIVIKKGLPFKFITENGFTLEQELEILKAWEDAKKGKNVIGPFKGDEALEYLKKQIKWK